MPPRPDSQTLFDRFRRPSALRVVFIIAALLASQSSLACAFEGILDSQGIEIVVNDVSGEDCCTSCVNCANCGSCHSSAVSPRAGSAHLSFLSISFAKLSLATAAPKLWTPPALLRPPINAA
jgi:hypothetical protein